MMQLLLLLLLLFFKSAGDKFGGYLSGWNLWDGILSTSSFFVILEIQFVDYRKLLLFRALGKLDWNLVADGREFFFIRFAMGWNPLHALFQYKKLEKKLTGWLRWLWGVGFQLKR